MTPGNQVRTFLLACSELGARVFRSNVGLAWAGSKITKHADGSITIHDPRPFKAGVKGMSDTTGWQTITITPSMVGQKIAQYVAIEAKLGTGRLSDDQKTFIRIVREHGGLAGVARSVEDVSAILSGEARLK